jgi:hypothetical protein
MLLLITAAGTGKPHAIWRAYRAWNCIETGSSGQYPAASTVRSTGCAPGESETARLTQTRHSLGNVLQDHSYKSLACGYASGAFNAASMSYYRQGSTRRDWPQFGVGHLRDFELIVADAKMKVCLARHDDGPGANSGQRFCEIPVESIICTDIGMLPCPEGLRFFFDLDPQHRGLVRLGATGQTHTAVFSPSQKAWCVELGSAA